ncbi:aldose epimerase [Corynebacterium ulcerans]|uniref:aldose epimerase n=1 Tax=Corynebacterium ulcerans TaxID=65058 RepID=UPI000C775C55|nr:aldose epimerase [Corynebacterium ulcerans]PLV99205.1 aldose epimerase [Corynebacterium ulcerans]
MTTTLNMPEDRGHLISATTSDCGEILFMSSIPDMALGGSIRGGVPIIAPWFGKLMGHDELQHGWARRKEWEVLETSGGLDARMNHDDWDLRLAVQSTSHGFAMMLKCRNASSVRRNLQLAFHPYFYVADVLNTTVTAPQETFTSDGGLLEEFRLSAPAPLLIDDGQRRITVKGQGNDHFIVWNPGEKLANEMSDMGTGEWRNFVCVEPALLGEDSEGVSVAPWDWVHIGMTVQVEATPE